MDEIKKYLTLNNKLHQYDENIHPRIVGNYTLDREDVSKQVVDWVLYYLEDRSCPYQLAVPVAKNIAQEIDDIITKQIQEDADLDAEKVLNSWNLYTEAIKKIPSMCSSFLEPGKEEEVLSSSFAPYTTSIFAIKNKRRKMEDRHVIHHDLNWLLDLKDMPAHSYYAVFDGHSGIDAASYASAHLHINIAKHPAFLSDTPTAISEAYKITDENFLKRCSVESIKSGSTAVCALIRERTVYLSWLGDSQAVLVKEGKPVIVTNPHRPDRADEQKRIEDLGGHITQMGVLRVNGVLAVTRAFGDPDHKPYISSEPDVTTIHLDGSEDFLILACDGLWDGMSPEDVTSALYNNLTESHLDEPLETSAAKLVHQSKLQGSEDNITAIVVFLRDIKAIKEYATRLVKESSFQLNFLGMNGEGRAVDESKDVQNTPCTKPTILELNGASTKKLKNAANVLSSAGITDPSYSCPYPGSAIEGISYQNISTDNSIFIQHQNTASCLPPEATALSELPTPPIDDILASQQFEKLSDDLYRGLNAISPELHVSENSEPLAISADIVSGLPLAELITINPTSVDHVQKSSLSKPEEVTDAINTLPKSSIITPDEAVDIASCVVSNTIETAVKCLSESELCQPVSPVCSQKLNPYAEPFVMRSFIPDDIQQDESCVADNPLNNNESPISPPGEKNTIQIDSDKCSDNPTNAQCDDLLVKNFVKDQIESSNINQNAFETSVNDQTEEVGVNLEKAPKEDILASEISQPNPESPKLSDQGLSLNVQNVSSMDSEIVMPNKTETSDVSGDMEEGAVDPVPPVNNVDQTENKNLTPDTLASVENTDLLVSVDKINIEACQLSLQLETEIANPISNIPVPAESQTTVQLSDMPENISLKDQNDLNLDSCNSKPVSEAEEVMSKTPVNDQIIIMQELNQPVSESVQNVSVIAPSSNVISDVPSEANKSLLPDTASVILESVTKDSFTLINIEDETKSTAAIPPSDQIDDCHIETFAVDLQTVPDGVPEAEGVTEDIDSDSEKDGGWSYMKGNTVGNQKPKSGEPIPKNEKSTSKQDTNSKLIKDTEKTVLDNKNKIKNITTVEKNKKPVADKKVLDVKEKKPTRTLSSTLPKTNIDKGKPASTISRVKKDASTAKVTSAAPTKLLRPAAARNAATLSKPVQSTAAKEENNQTAQTKPVGTSSACNVKPKSTLGATGTKTNVRPGTSSTLSKGQPSNQSTKSNTVPTSRSATLNRPAVSTIPNKVLAKPSALSKCAPSESKLKPLPNPIKKTVSPMAKKPDVKETKDIVNKQISARSNAAVGMLNKSAAVRNATTSNKPPTTLGNKPAVPKSRTAPVKNDVGRKDVPKAPLSKLTSKSNAPTKMSRDITKRAVTKSVNIQGKKSEKKTELANEDIGKTTEITPVSEEKFILEVNDKEVIVKEQEVATNSEQVLIPVENGIIESVKPVEEISSAGSAVENLL